MTQIARASLERVQALVLRVFDREGGRWSKPDVIVEAKLDFDGDDALYVTAVLPDDVIRPNGPQQIDLQIDLGKRLMAEGDFRLIYLTALNRSEADELKQLRSEDLPSDA